MAVDQQQRLDDLAEEMTRRLSIPFQAASNGTIGFRDRLRVTDWAVPLMFDGHARRDGDAIIPTDFVGHVLWPALQATRGSAKERPWWSCRVTAETAEALLAVLRTEDEREDETDDQWIIGRDVLLDDVHADDEPASSRRRRVA